MVMVADVIEEDVNPPEEYVGHVEALQTVDLRARVEGFLEQVNFKEGADVEAGTLLFVIEPAPYQVQVNANKAMVAQADASLRKASQFLERARNVSSGGVSATDMDNAEAEELHARAQLEQARANLDAAKIQLSYTSIEAPISGRIGRSTFTKGNLVGPGSGPLASLVQLDPVRVVYSISENDFPEVRMAFEDAKEGKTHPLLEPRIKLPGGKILETKGQIDFVDNTVDPNTGTIAVWALFPNPEVALLPGQYVTVLVSRTEPKMMPVVPQSAVLEDRDGRYVLTVDEKSQVVVRRITTGQLTGSNWAVASGLTVGEKVISEGVQKVQPGMVVKTAAAGEQNGR
jgi:membrane fusion protein (multidrug efflux system)